MYRGSYMTLRVSKSSINCWSKARTFRPANRRYSSMVDVSDQRCTFRSVPTKQPVRCLPCRTKDNLKQGKPQANHRGKGHASGETPGVSSRHRNRTVDVAPAQTHKPTMADRKNAQPAPRSTGGRQTPERYIRQQTLLQWINVGWFRTSSNACNASRMACMRDRHRAQGGQPRRHQHTHVAVDQQHVSTRTRGRPTQPQTRAHRGGLAPTRAPTTASTVDKRSPPTTPSTHVRLQGCLQRAPCSLECQTAARG